jgi:hypothetical protein
MPAPLVVAAGKIAVSVLSTPTGRKIVGGVIVAALILPGVAVVGVGVAVAMSAAISGVGGGTTGDMQARCLTDATDSTGGGGTAVTALTAAQTTNALTIIGVAKSIAIPGSNPASVDADRERAAVIAIATSMQEAHLTNLSGGDRDSLGLFQQRPSMGWGTPAQIADPVYATTAFLYGAGTNGGLVDVAGWQGLELTVASQAVQRSGYPGAYAQWEAIAQATVTSSLATAPAIPVSPTLDRPTLGTGTAVSVTLIPGGDASCGGGGSGSNSTGADTTGVYRTPAAWGGYQNGQIPAGALCIIPWAGSYLLRCDAVTALEALNAQYEADHAGASLGVSDAYRSYANQEAEKSAWCLRGDCAAAATPGTSNHGLALAVDLDGFGNLGDFSSPNYAWMKTHASAFGFLHPPFMDAGGTDPLEPWHWEYMAAPAAAGATS